MAEYLWHPTIDGGHNLENHHGVYIFICWYVYCIASILCCAMAIWRHAEHAQHPHSSPDTISRHGSTHSAWVICRTSTRTVLSRRGIDPPRTWMMSCTTTSRRHPGAFRSRSPTSWAWTGPPRTACAWAATTSRPRSCSTSPAQAPRSSNIYILIYV